MEPYVITEKDEIKTINFYVCLILLAYTALIILNPPGIDYLIDHAFRDLKSFMELLFFILWFMLPVCILIKNIIRSRKEMKVFLKVDEKGLYLNIVKPCFLKWDQIDRIEICIKMDVPDTSTSLYFEVYKKKERIIKFRLQDFLGGIYVPDLVDAINTFSGHPDMVKIRK